MVTEGAPRRVWIAARIVNLDGLDGYRRVATSPPTCARAGVGGLRGNPSNPSKPSTRGEANVQLVKTKGIRSQ